MTIPSNFGAKPININWDVVRGDTSELRIEFFNFDEVTRINTTGWVFSSTTYDSRGDVLDRLTTTPGSGYVDIIASSETTSLWGSGFESVVGELAFDLQVTINGTRVWTPILGNIRVFGDVTSGSL